MIMRIITPDHTKTVATPLAREFGARDLWELWLLDEAEAVPCGSIRTFLNYLFSEGTTLCQILNASPLATGSVDVRLTGPLADDERNHLLRYRLTRGNVGRLKEPEKDVLVGGLIKHCSPTQDNKPNQKVGQALTALGVSLR
jgi:hypothetical protein